MSVVGSSNAVQDSQPWFLPQDEEILGGRLPLSLYLRLATSYMQLGHADYALNAYLQVGGTLSKCPCSCLWNAYLFDEMLSEILATLLFTAVLGCLAPWLLQAIMAQCTLHT